MMIGVLKETYPGEKRVAMTGDVAQKIQKLGFQLCVQSGAGNEAQVSDQELLSAGCEILNTATEVWAKADLILKVRAPSAEELKNAKPDQCLISFVWPAQNKDLLQVFCEKKLNVLAMDSVPRISRAQKMDALSSMANIAGYRAVIESAHHFGRFFTGQITAAGKVPPAKVLVIGAGVAGLAAIGAASGLGAIVRAFDTRLEVKDQVKSMGGEFLELEFTEDGSGEGGYAKQMSAEFIKAEMDLFAAQAKEVDIIITTALIPGKPAPKLITTEMVKSMKAGSVIVDMAAEQGGNCELTEPGKVAVKEGVTIIGYTDLPSRLAKQSSQLYSSNLWRLLEDLCKSKNGEININMEDEVIRGATVVHNGQITWPPPAPKLSATPQKPAATSAASVAKPTSHGGHGQHVNAQGPWTLLVILGLALLGLGQVAPPAFMSLFTVFVLSCFIGYMVIWNVTASLHTPLMSVTNAISGIIAIGALLQVSSDSMAIQVLAGIAILVSTINIVGGFWVTERMLSMFKK